MPENPNPVIDERKIRNNHLGLFLMLTGPALMAWYNYGPRALVLITVCMLTGEISDLAGLLLVKSRKREIFDFSAALTGLLIALMLPADFPYHLAAMACVFAVIVAKLPFGSFKGELLNPAAAALAFLSVSQAEKLFSYPKVLEHSGLFLAEKGLSPGGESVSSMLQFGDSMRLNHINFFKLVTGAFSGPMGTGCIVVLLAGGVYFLFSRPRALLNTLGMITGSFLVAFFFPRILTGRLSSVVFELMSGSLAFAALFLITDETTSPQKGLHRFFYGLFAGLTTMALRHFGVFEEGVWFAVLLANAVWVVFSSPRPSFEEPTESVPDADPLPAKGGGSGA